MATGSYFIPMQTVGIKALKNNLSEYIRAAAAGETIQVTDRGRVVVEIVPVRSALDDVTPEQRLAELARLGRVTLAKRARTGPPRRIGGMSFDVLMKQLDADREDR